jgi:hypothetical protein
MKKRILYLHLKKIYFDQIRSGTKTCEFRSATEYWRKRLVGKCYDEVHLMLGYPKPDETDKIIIRKWTMLAKEWILHEGFGPDPIEVFVICFGTENDPCYGMDQGEKS